MSERPELTKLLDGKTFRSYYYLKEELVAFCRENGLPVSGGKLELTDRIACFLDTGKAPAASARRRLPAYAGPITEETLISATSSARKSTERFLPRKSESGFLLTSLFRNGRRQTPEKRMGTRFARTNRLLRKEKRKSRPSTGSLNIISIFAISSRKIRAERCRKRFSAGNTKRTCKGTTAMKKATLRPYRKPQLVGAYFYFPYFSSISFVWAQSSSSARA